LRPESAYTSNTDYAKPREIIAEQRFGAHVKLAVASRTYSWDSERAYLVGLARAFGGALLFGLPVLMTMETWELGAQMSRLRLTLLIVGLLPLLVGLAFYLGFERVSNLFDAILDAFVAVAVAAFLATAILFVFGVLDPQDTLEESIGRVALQGIAGSIGALLAQSQLGQAERKRDRRRESVFAEYFYMAAGALFLSANVAPTEEVAVIAHLMGPWHALALIVLSLVLMHAFVYAVDFKGQHARAEHVSLPREFIRFTVIGYLLAAAISASICWCLGRFDGIAATEILSMTIVLSFPAAIGAAAARLVL
jgi:putative integral membrane protein (TIGR02587 family)